MKPFFDCLGRIKQGSAFWDAIGRDDLKLRSRKVAVTSSSVHVASRPVRGGAGFGDPETNRLVEEVAVSAATRSLEDSGWRVRSVESEKCGYDLHCTRQGDVRHVEVKGTQGQGREFIVTKGEMDRATDDPKFRLIVVSGALTQPHVQEFTGKQFVQRFAHTPIQFRSRRKAV